MTGTLVRLVLLLVFVNAAAAAPLPLPRFSLDPASPSIIGSLTPDDVVRAGPATFIPGTTLGLQDDFATGAFDYLDALSFGRDVIANPLYFSVDRVAVGVAGSAVFAEAAPGVADAAQDVYVALPPFDTNALVFDGTALGLVSGFFGDDLGAIEFDRRPLHVYFSFDALSATNLFGLGALAGDIYVDTFSSLYASGELHIGLNPLDDLDALVLDDRFAPGVVNPGIDRALFSLSPFSPSTFTFTGLDYIPCVPGHMSPADVCATSFLRSYGIWAPASTIGLLRDDNLDALDTQPLPEPSPLALAVAALAMIVIVRTRAVRRGVLTRRASYVGMLIAALAVGGQAHAQCAPPLEFDHQFVGNSPPVGGSAATLMLRLFDGRFRFIATDPLGETDTQTIAATRFRCFRNGAVVPCCNAGITRVIFESRGQPEIVQGDVLLAPYNRAVVDLTRGSSRIRYLLVPCASTPIIAGGRPKYRGQFKDKVFRRGQDIPKFSIPVADLAGGAPAIDIFKVGDAVKVRRLAAFAKQGNFMVTTWDWKNDRGWAIPDKLPVGAYTVIAKSIAGGKEVQTGQCVFWVIFHKPDGLTAAEEAAYLYDKGKAKRDERSIHHNRYSNRIVVRDAKGVPQKEVVNGVMVNKQRFKSWMEALYTVDPFDENLFKLAINAVDGQTDEPTTSEGLQDAIANVIFYTEPSAAANVPTMFRGVTVKQFKDAYAGTEAQLIRGQCLDYANSLTGFARSVGIPGRVATDIQNGGFTYHEWTEIFLKNPPAGTDKWFSYDAMDYTSVPHTVAKDAATPPQGSARRAAAAYGPKAYEVPVGNTNWVAEPGTMQVDFTVSRVQRVANAADALFEKCEGNKYDNGTCNQPDPPIQETSPYLMLLLDDDVYNVGQQIVATATVTNIDPVPLSAQVKLRITRYASGDDGRDAFGDPVLGVNGSGTFGASLFETTFAVNLPPSESTVREFTVPMPWTDFPRDRHLASLEMTGAAEDQVTLDFLAVPAFEVDVTVPSSVGPLDVIPVIVEITNPTAGPINNVTIAVEFAAFYEFVPGAPTTIPVLAAGETRVVTLNVRPRERNRVTSLPMSLVVRSDNGGRLVRNLEPEVVAPATLFVPSTAIVRPAAGTFPVTFTVQNIGSVDAHNVVIDLTPPSDVPAGSVVFSPSDFVIASLAAGQEQTLSTMVTTSLPRDVHVEIAAAATSAEAGSGLLSINLP